MPNLTSARDNSAYAQFSIDDYGRQGDERPYQVVQPAYDAPKFLDRFNNLDAALRECKTLCTLQGKPFRVVRWERAGSGARGGVPCKVCKGCPPSPRFPQRRPGELHGYPDATPIAEVRPDGQHIVYNHCGKPKLVGRSNYVVSHTPFPREFHPRPLRQNYLEAVKTAQLYARRRGRRAYICSDFGAKCKGRNPKYWVPVVYVNPGGLAMRYPDDPVGTTTVNPVGPGQFKELVAQSRGASLLGQGA